MAPPSSRRSGHSRRAQYGQFTGYVLAAIGAALGAVLLAISLWRPTSFNGVRGAAADTIAPVGKAGAIGRVEGQGLFDKISGYLAAGKQNAELNKEVELARIRLKEADAVRQENARLKALLGFRDFGRETRGRGAPDRFHLHQRASFCLSRRRPQPGRNSGYAGPQSTRRGGSGA